jgi:hypothetical protein
MVTKCISSALSGAIFVFGMFETARHFSMRQGRRPPRGPIDSCRESDHVDVSTEPRNALKAFLIWSLRDLIHSQYDPADEFLKPLPRSGEIGSGW